MNEAILEGEREIGSIKLRPWTTGSKNFADKMGLSIFTGDSEGLSQSEIEWQIFAFAWLHSEPLKEVIRSVRDGSYREKVDEFLFRLPIDLLPKLCEEITRISELVRKQMVAVIPKPNSEDKGAPPNL